MIVGRIRHWDLTTFLKAYVVVALVVATIFSPLELSLASVLLLVWYLYSWRWEISALANLLTEYFMFFAIPLLLVSITGLLFSLLVTLPVLLLVTHELKKIASSLKYENTRYRRQPTRTYLMLLFIAVIMLSISLLVGSLPLIATNAIAIGYFGVLNAAIVKRLPLRPVEDTYIEQRIIAGSEAIINIKIIPRTKIGGMLLLEAPYEWVKISPNILSFRGNELVVKISLSPGLAGPSTIRLTGQATDCWGLIRVSFELEAIRLYVIPRARYAAWLAKKYLAGTKPGTLSLISYIETLKPIHGLRRGIEYYGSQLYQPGDSLKHIDWKHSLKYNELISKEFAEFQGQSAIILINLATEDAEEADKLAYKIIVTAISLARENIPAALAAYNHESVRLTTPMLPPARLVVQSLQITRDIVTFINPVKYLNPPNVNRLRANLSRVRFSEGRAAEVLARLLQLEYDNLRRNARLNPATHALLEVLNKVDRQSNLVIISQSNHDAEALAFNSFNFTRKENAVITI